MTHTYIVVTIILNSKWNECFSMSMSSLEGDDDDDNETDDESTASAVDASHQPSAESRTLWIIISRFAPTDNCHLEFSVLHCV